MPCASSPKRPRIADLGVSIGTLARGEHNAITDVPGVCVGHATVREIGLNTGVTAIVPQQLGADRPTLPAGLAVGNGYGKLVGATQLRELGSIETPILLTSTLSVFRVADALLTEVLALPHHADTTSLNPVVGETNDGYLSDIRRRAVTETEVAQALDAAGTGEAPEGSVGAGAGTVALGFKGGIGTASRLLRVGQHEVTIGAMVQSNFGGVLRIAGVPLPADELLDANPAEPQGNSCMIVVATDAPVDARQLDRVARRAVFAMRSVGANYSHTSGDYAIAFTVAEPGMPLTDTALSPLFAATMDAVEEALINSVLRAETRIGPGGRTAYAIPVDAVQRRLERAGVT